jgi:hypothetical protein
MEEIMSKAIKKATEMLRDGANDHEIQAVTNLNPNVIKSIRDSLALHHLDRAHE